MNEPKTKPTIRYEAESDGCGFVILLVVFVFAVVAIAEQFCKAMAAESAIQKGLVQEIDEESGKAIWVNPRLASSREGGK